MPKLISASAAIALGVALALTCARATSEYDYARGEYVIIRDGLAPNRQLSLASHGEAGNASFHVWLMAEPAHRKIAALDDISSENNLDTAADAYHAFWAGDSRHVGVAFRSDRHQVQLNLYGIDGRRTREIKGPSLFHEVTGRDVRDGDDLHVRNAIVEWHRGNRFRLREYALFVGSDDRLAKLFGAYGRVAEKLEDGRLSIAFSADAECELLPGGRYRVIGLEPGKPGDADGW